ncbi:MAG: hypothetical protein AB1505_11260 [Candidatus Latescibacterota bacterium]
MVGRLAAAAALVLLGLWAAGCGVPERDNPLDPINANAAAAELLIGTWSRQDAEANEVYTFKAEGRVELLCYSAPGGGVVDRGAPFPQTLQISYAGTYVLRGNLLRITLTTAQTNEPGGIPPTLPPDDRVVVIEVGARQLAFVERDGRRVYTRM